MLGHEITGEVVEIGPDVEFIKVGDLVSVPFNIACGRCRNCKEGKTGICLNVNPDRPGSAYGYVDMGGWVGGQAQYVLVPYADWNLLKFPDKDQAMEKILDLTMLVGHLPDRLPRLRHAPGSQPGSTVYIAGAGPVGLAAAASAFLLGAAVVIVGDLNKDRLAQARSFGCETVDVSEGEPKDQIEQILGVPEVDCGVDAVGFEARGHGADAATEKPGHRAQLADGRHPGRRRARHPRPVRDRRPRRGGRGGQGRARCRSGSASAGRSRTPSPPASARSCATTAQLMKAILHDRVQIAKTVNATPIPLDQAPAGLRGLRPGRGHASSCSTRTA